MGKIPLEERVDVIIARDSGISYSDVISTFEITPHQFHWIVTRDLELLLQDNSIEPRKLQIVKTILGDEERKRELFYMGPDLVIEQYNRIKEGDQKRFYAGTYSHPKNVENIVYYALTSDKPELASTNRKKVIEVIKRLPEDLNEYLETLRLTGLMQHAFEKEEKNSPLAVIKAFDRAYQKITGDVSLFDLSQEIHLHEWGIGGNAPSHYWKNPKNVEKVVYHVLTEDEPNLASDQREEVIKVIQKLPNDLATYFHNLRLRGLMKNAFEKEEKDSPLAVINVFDRVYQDKTGDESLFDLSQETHLHEWEIGGSAPNYYLQKQENEERAVYHVLTENNPELASTDREKVIKAIRELPINRAKYFRKLRINCIMDHAFRKGEKYSPLAVINVFDRAYQKITGDSSLFDQSQPSYLKVVKRRIAA